MAYKTNELPALLRLGAWNFDPAKGTIVTDFQSGHGYTLSGTTDGASNVNDTSTFVAGSQCATVVSTGTGASAILQNTAAISSTDTTTLQGVVVLKCDDTTHLNSLQFSMGNSGAFTNSYAVQLNAQAYLASGAWIVVSFSFGDAVSQGSPTRTGINAIRVFHRDDNTGNKVTVHYQGIWLMPNAATQPGAPFPNGAASICFDDGFATSWVTAKPYLDRSGLRASAYLIKDELGQSGRMTLAQCQSVQDQSGWEVNAHAYTDADHAATDTAITAEQLIWDMSTQKEWLLVNGLYGQGFAYPKGAANPAVVTAARQFFRYARGTQGMLETYPAGDPYRLKGFSSISEFSGGTAPSTISGAGGKIDLAVTNASWIMLTFHNVIPAVVSVTMSGNTATMVFAAAIPTTSTWQASSTITMAGFTPSGLNGNHTILSVVNSTTITVNIGSNPGNSTIQGTAVTATTDCSYPGYTAIIDKLVSSGIRVLPVAEAFTGGQQTSAAPSFPLSVANGGTGQASLAAYGVLAAGTSSTGAVQQVSGTGSSGQVLTSNGASALPSWQPASSGFANPMTTLGDIIYENATPAPARLAGDTSNTRKFLREQASGGVAQAPAWDTLQSGDIPNNAANTSGTASNITGTLDQVPAPAANVSLNSHKITSLSNGSAASDAAALGQVVNSISATDTSIVVTGGSGTTPAVATGTLDVIATQHPPAANWSNNSHKITSLLAGTAATTDAANAGQLPAVWGAGDQGLLAWTHDIAVSAPGGSQALATAGTLYTMAMKLPVNASVTNIVTVLTATGSSLTTGQCFAALYQGFGGALIGVTADQASNWGSASLNNPLTMALAGGPFAVSAGIVVVAFWFNGTTGPSLWRANGNSGTFNIGLAGAASRWGKADTGKTTTAPSTLGTVSASTLAAYWCAIS